MTAVPEGGEWSAARPGRTLPPVKTRYLLYRRLGGPQGRSGRAENLVSTRIFLISLVLKMPCVHSSTNCNILSASSWYTECSYFKRHYHSPLHTAFRSTTSLVDHTHYTLRTHYSAPSLRSAQEGTLTQPTGHIPHLLRPSSIERASVRLRP